VAFRPDDDCLGTAAILAYTMPALAIPLSVCCSRAPDDRQALVWRSAWRAGAFWLLGEGIVSLGKAPLGSLLVLGAAASWALGVIVQKRYRCRCPLDRTPPGSLLLGAYDFHRRALFSTISAALKGKCAPRRLSALRYNVLIAFAWAHWAWIKNRHVGQRHGVLAQHADYSGGRGPQRMLFLGERPTWAEYAALLLVLGSLLTVVIPARQVR